MSEHAWCRDVRRDNAVRAAEDGRSGPLPTLEEAILATRAMMPKSVSATSAPEQENKGNGMRTERVTLEVTHDLDAPLGDWLVQLLDETRGYDESVRVVEEAHFDDLAQVAMDRDAAIRERDEYRRALTVENDHALRITAERDALKARVAELESAPAASAVGWIARHEQPPRFNKYVMCRWDVCACQGYARDVSYGVAKRGPDGMWRAPNNVEKIAPMHWMPLPPGVEGGDSWEAAPAASVAANSSESPVSSEPVALSISPAERDGLQAIDDGLRRHGNGFVVIPGSDSYRAVRSILDRHTTSPPPARGWLTQEEREALLHVSATHGSWSNDDQPIRVIKSLLARSSPPEVVLPPEGFVVYDGETPIDARDRQWLAALTSAGVPWKEVGRE